MYVIIYIYDRVPFSPTDNNCNAHNNCKYYNGIVQNKIKK